MLYKRNTRFNLFLATFSSLVLSSGCGFNPVNNELEAPETRAAARALFGYVPVDPLPVESKGSQETCDVGTGPEQWIPPIQSLPDNAVRVAIRDFNSSGTFSVSTNEIGTSGNSYQVIIDYMNSDVANEDVMIARYDKNGEQISLNDGNHEDSSYRISPVFLIDRGESKIDASNQFTEQYSIPIFVGAGLRMTADVTVLEGNVNLNSLGAIGLAAEAGKVEGSMVVQTLGLSSQQVAGLLPLPSELNTTTIQNAIVALGAIKAIIHDDDTIFTPRVLGFYQSYNISNPRIVNAMVSSMAETRPTWWRNCHRL